MQTIVRHAGEGEATWFLNSLVTTKVTRDEAGTYGITEQVVTAASNPPPHVHAGEEEAFYVLDGEVDVEVDGAVTRCAPGAFALVPRGAVHAFRVLTPTARLLVIGSSSEPVANGGLQHFFTAAGEPAAAPVLPEPSAPDPATLTAIAEAHGIAILPPA